MEEEGIGLGEDREVYKNRAFAVRTEDIIMQRLCFLPFSNFFFFFGDAGEAARGPPLLALSFSVLISCFSCADWEG